MFELKQDAIYRRSEIHQEFGGQPQYGISTPQDYKVIFLFTGSSATEHGYHDSFREDGVFLYNGEGQNGDQRFIRGNLKLRDHQLNGEEVHLFQSLGGGQVKYLGQMMCVGYHLKDVDTRGVSRKIIQFELMPIENIDATGQDVEDLLSNDLSILREKALAASSTSTHEKERTVSIRERSAAIRAYGLKRANGVCEYCQSPAPFLTSEGTPYLEVHHIKKLADGGPDHPESIIGICPNCHRRAHYGADKEMVNDSMMELVAMIESKYRKGTESFLGSH